MPPEAGDSPSRIIEAAGGGRTAEVRFLGEGISTSAWRAESAVGPLIVLMERADAPEPGRLLARAAVLGALAERGAKGARPVATYRSPAVVDPLGGERPWLVTTWTPGEPASLSLREAAIRDLGEWLAILHAIPCDGYGLLEDTLEGIRGRAPDREAGITSRWHPGIWPYDGRPLVAHPVARLAPQHVGALAAMRDQLLRYAAHPAAVALCQTDLNPAHLYVEGDRLAGVIDLGDAAILPPAFDIASFAYSFGWAQAELLLEAYEPSSVLRDVRRAEAQQLAVVLALQKVEKHTTRRPNPARVQAALAFLAQTLPLAVRRDA